MAFRMQTPNTTVFGVLSCAGLPPSCLLDRISQRYKHVRKRTNSPPIKQDCTRIFVKSGSGHTEANTHGTSSNRPSTRSPTLWSWFRMGALLLPAFCASILLPSRALATSPTPIAVVCEAPTGNSHASTATLPGQSQSAASGSSHAHAAASGSTSLEAPETRNEPKMMIAGIAASVVALMLVSKAMRQAQERRRALETPDEDLDTNVGVDPKALEEWKNVPEEWWKTDGTMDDGEWWNQDRSEWGSSDNGSTSGSTESTSVGSSGTGDGSGVAGASSNGSLQGADEWQEVKEEWWKRDDLKDDPNWWERDRDELLPDTPSTTDTSTSGTSNGSWVEAAKEPVLPTLLDKAKREVQYVWDSVRYNVVTLGSVLTRRSFAPPKEARGTGREFAKPCDYQVDEQQCTAEQKDFLLRKRLAELGEGPVMPEACNCPKCAGFGSLICWHCKGSGRNDRGVEEIMGNTMENIIPRNGMMEVRWMLMKGGPCFLCQGKLEVGCPDCEGTGLAGGVTSKYVSD